MSQQLSTQLTDCLPDLLAGNEEAFSKVFTALFAELCATIASQQKSLRVHRAEPQDIANSVFLALHQAIQTKRLNELNDSRHLLGVLKLIAKRKTLNLLRAELTQKKGNGLVRGESIFATGYGLDQAAVDQSDLNPLYVAGLREHWQRLLQALNPECQAIALGKLYNKTNPELAAELSLSLATVERRLVLIRTIWLSIE